MKFENILPINGPSVDEVKKYINKYNNELIVIKCGGSVLLDPNLFNINSHPSTPSAIPPPVSRQSDYSRRVRARNES